MNTPANNVIMASTRRFFFAFIFLFHRALDLKIGLEKVGKNVNTFLTSIASDRITSSNNTKKKHEDEMSVEITLPEHNITSREPVMVVVLSILSWGKAEGFSRIASA